VGDLTVAGTLSPGHSIGTLTVNGSLVFTTAATYLVEVSPASADRTNVSGTATLAGTVQAVFQPGNYLVNSYTILHSADLGGSKFDGLVSNNLLPGFAASLSYTTTDVLLDLTAALGAAGGLGGNQQNVAGTINNFFNNGGALPPGFLGVFGLTGGNLNNALALLSGETATGSQQGAFQLMTQFLGLMLDPFVDGRGGVGGGTGAAIGFAPERPAMPDDVALAYASVLKAPVYKATPFEQRFSVWGSAYGGTNRTNGDPNVAGSHDLTARAGGFAAGLDYRVTPDSVVGFALAGGGTNWGLAQGLGNGKSDAAQAGIYGSTRWGAAYVAASLAYTSHWMSTDPLRPRRRSSCRELQRAERRRPPRRRLSGGDGIRHAHTLCGAAGARLLDAGLQRNRRQRRRLRPCLQRAQRQRHAQRARQPLRQAGPARRRRGALRYAPGSPGRTTG